MRRALAVAVVLAATGAARADPLVSPSILDTKFGPSGLTLPAR